MRKVCKVRTLAAIMTVVMVFSNASAVVAAEGGVEETVQTEEPAASDGNSVTSENSSNESASEETTPNTGADKDSAGESDPKKTTPNTGADEDSTGESDSEKTTPDTGVNEGSAGESDPEKTIPDTGADEDSAGESGPEKTTPDTGSNGTSTNESDPENTALKTESDADSAGESGSTETVPKADPDSEETTETVTDETLVNATPEAVTDLDAAMAQELEIMALQETETEGELIKLDTPTISWKEEEGKIKGYYVMSLVEHCEDSYVVEIYKDGSKLTTVYQGVNHDPAYVYDMRSHLEESGAYKLRVKAEGNELTGYADSEWSEFTSEWNYTKPEALPTPEAPEWVANDPGKISFSLPENAGGYRVWVCRVGGSKNGSSTFGNFSSPIIYDAAQNMYEEGAYTVTVTALSADVTVYSHSEESAHSVIYDTRENSTNVNDRIDLTIENLDSSNAVETIEKLTNKTTADELKLAMQTDEGVSNKIETLENKYKTAMGISVETPVVDESLSDVLPNAEGQIKVVGAALNSKEKDAKLTLKITPPHGEVPVDATVYHNFVKLDISLEGVSGELDVPVTITMPIPKGVLPNRMRIIHYSDNNTVKEVLAPEIIGEDTVSFVLTSFSNFVFANEKDEVDKPTTPEEPDKPTTPEEPDKPTTPEEPDKLTTPEEPDKPTTPEEPDKPTTPEEPVKPIIPDDSKPSVPGDSNNASDAGSSSSSSSSASNAGSANVIKAWKPSTPEDIKRYSYVAAVKPIYTASVKNATVVNSVQGTKCIEAIETLFPEYTIARTYNIFADILRGNKVVYQTEFPIQITLSIEKDLYKAGREFALVCVSKNGEVQIYNDMDKNPDTITINSNTFYAYALVYKDMAGLEVQ